MDREQIARIIKDETVGGYLSDWAHAVKLLNQDQQEDYITGVADLILSLHWQDEAKKYKGWKSPEQCKECQTLNDEHTRTLKEALTALKCVWRLARNRRG